MRLVKALDKRQMLLDFQAQVPGISVRSLSRMAGLPESSVRLLLGVRSKQYSGTASGGAQGSITQELPPLRSWNLEPARELEDLLPGREVNRSPGAGVRTEKSSNP